MVAFLFLVLSSITSCVTSFLPLSVYSSLSFSFSFPRVRVAGETPSYMVPTNAFSSNVGVEPSGCEARFLTVGSLVRILPRQTQRLRCVHHCVLVPRIFALLLRHVPPSSPLVPPKQEHLFRFLYSPLSPLFRRVLSGRRPQLELECNQLHAGKALGRWQPYSRTICVCPW